MDEERKFEDLVDKLESVSAPIKERRSRDYIGGFGLCDRCTHFLYRRTQFNRERALCRQYGRPDTQCSRNDPMVECSDFYPTGQMDVREMALIATIIDPDKKGRIGF
jgi:hypothetical protein